MEHVDTFRSDRSWKKFISANSYREPRIQVQEIVEMELEAYDSVKLPIKVTVVLAKGRDVLARFTLGHVDHRVHVYTPAEEDMIQVVCEDCDESLLLHRASLEI